MRNKTLKARFLSFTTGGNIAKILILLFLLAGNISMANSRRHHSDSGRAHKNGISDLTPDQKTKIKLLRTGLQKEMLPLKNQLGEKRARMQTLETAEKVDMTAINTQIDEIKGLEAKMYKLKAAQRQEIRMLLTAEQRIHFDTKPKKHERGKNKRHGRGGPGQE